MVGFYTILQWPKFNRMHYTSFNLLQRTLLIFCGIPGSGKTTIARLVANKLHSAVHIETDTIRSMVAHRAYTGGESRFVYRSAAAVAGEALKAGYDAILDGTYVREEFREEPISNLAGLYKAQLTIHVACDIGVAYERNLTRSDKVPKESFVRLYSRFETPLNALRIDSDKVTPELASDAILTEIGRLRSQDGYGRPHD